MSEASVICVVRGSRLGVEASWGARVAAACVGLSLLCVSGVADASEVTDASDVTGAEPSAPVDPEDAPLPKRWRFHMRAGAGPSFSSAEVHGSVSYAAANGSGAGGYYGYFDGIGTNVEAALGVAYGPVRFGLLFGVDVIPFEGVSESGHALGFDADGTDFLERNATGLFGEWRAHPVPLVLGFHVSRTVLYSRICCFETPDGSGAFGDLPAPSGLDLGAWVGTEWIFSRNWSLYAALRGAFMASDYDLMEIPERTSTSTAVGIITGVALN